MLAQVGAVVSAYSDYRFRGVSLSDGRPVGILDLSYDARGGAYAALSGSVVATHHEGLKALGVIANAGYAKPVSHRLTGDLGILYATYSHYSGVTSGRSYAEIYAGLSGKSVGARLAFSPNYLGTVKATIRAEVNGHIQFNPSLLVEGVVGVIAPVSSRRYGPSSSAGLDARASVSQRLGRVSLHAALTGRTAGLDRDYGSGQRRVALIVGISAPL